MTQKHITSTQSAHLGIKHTLIYSKWIATYRSSPHDPIFGRRWSRRIDYPSPLTTSALLDTAALTWSSAKCAESSHRPVFWTLLARNVMLTSLTLSSGSLCSLALVVGKKRMSERKMLTSEIGAVQFRDIHHYLRRSANVWKPTRSVNDFATCIFPFIWMIMTFSLFSALGIRVNGFMRYKSVHRHHQQSH